MKTFFCNSRGTLLPMPLLSIVFIFCSLSLVHAAALGKDRRESPDSRTITLYNQSGRRVDLFWINRSNEPNTFHSNSDNEEGYPFGASQVINSFIGHEFEIREMPSKKTGECQVPGKCKTAYFQVNDQEGQKVTIDKDFNIKQEDDRTIAQDKADELLEACETEVRQQQQLLEPLQLVDAMTGCMEQKVNETLAKQEEERRFQAQLRQKMARELVPYACGDVDYETSEEVFNRSWNFEAVPGKPRQRFLMQVFHERPTSSIFQVPNFTTPEECRALKHFVSADGTYIPYGTFNDRTKQGILIHSLTNKFYELARGVLGWPDLDFIEQHNNHGVALLNIHKDSKGVSALPACTEKELAPYKTDPKKIPTTCRLPGTTPAKVATKHFIVEKPNQVASIFLFCDPMESSSSLGGIHFPDAAVHINRQPNLLVMVMHRSLDNPMLDEFTTNYHFCPNYDVLSHTFLVKEDPSEGKSEPDKATQSLEPKKSDVTPDSSKAEL